MESGHSCKNKIYLKSSIMEKKTELRGEKKLDKRKKEKQIQKIKKKK